MNQVDTLPGKLPTDLAHFVFSVALDMKDSLGARKLVADLATRMKPTKANRAGSGIADALLALPLSERLKTADRLRQNMGSTPPLHLARGLATMLWKTCKNKDKMSPQQGHRASANLRSWDDTIANLLSCADGMAKLLSQVDGREFGTWKSVFNFAVMMLERAKYVPDHLEQSGNESVEDKQQKLDQLRDVQRLIIKAITNEKMEQLKEQRLPLDAPGERAESRMIQDRGRELAEFRMSIANQLVMYDDLLPTCAEQRLPNMEREISAALQEQTNLWIQTRSVTGGGTNQFLTTPQNLKFINKLDSTDLVSQLALAPQKHLASGGAGSTWLYETSSPATPRLVIKFPRVDDQLTPSEMAHCEALLDEEFNAYKALHPSRDRKKTAICWSYGMVELQHPETGNPCKALVLEALDGEDLFTMQQELAFEAGNRHLLMEYPAIYQYATKRMLKASRELAAAGYLHADLKDGNVMVLSDGRIKVIDLGNAVKPGTHLYGPHGSPPFCAPEKYLGVQLWDGAPQIYLPHGTSDVYEGSAVAFYSSEMTRPRGTGYGYADPLSRREGKVLHTDEQGNAYRRGGDFLRVSKGESAMDATHPVGAYEKYYSKVLQYDAFHRPTLKEASLEPYVTDRIDPKKARVALKRAVIQYRHRVNGEQASAPSLVSNPLLNQTVPEKSSAGKLVSAHDLSVHWFYAHPGAVIPNAAHMLDEAVKWHPQGPQVDYVKVLTRLDGALRALRSTIGKKEDTGRLDEIIDRVYQGWYGVGTSAASPSPIALSLAVRATRIMNSVDEILSRHAADPRALPVLESARHICGLTRWVACEWHGLNAGNSYQELQDRLIRTEAACGSAIDNLKSRLDQIREEIVERHSAEPVILQDAHPVRAIADKLVPVGPPRIQRPPLPPPPPDPDGGPALPPPPPAPPRTSPPSRSGQLPNVKPGLASHRDEKSGTKWLGWKNAAEVPKILSAFNPNRKVIDIDTEALKLQEANRYNGLGVDLSPEEIALLLQHRDDIAAARSALLDDLEKYWGTSDPVKQKEDGYPKGVGTIYYSDFAKHEENMRDWLSKLDRLMLVLRKVDADKEKELHEQKERDEAQAAGKAVPVEPGSRLERFTTSRKNIDRLVDTHRKSSSTYALLSAKSKQPQSGSLESNAGERKAFRMVRTTGDDMQKDAKLGGLAPHMPLEVSGRDDGAPKQDGRGKTKGRWAVGNGVEEDDGGV